MRLPFNLVLEKAAPLWKEAVKYGLLALAGAVGWEIGKTAAAGTTALIAEGREALAERYAIAQSMRDLKKAERYARQATEAQARPSG